MIAPPRDAPAPVVVPSGVYRVLRIVDGAVMEVFAHDEPEAAQLAYRKVRAPKGLVRGVSLLRRDDCSKADEQALTRFAATLAGVPVAAKIQHVEVPPVEVSDAEFEQFAPRVEEPVMPTKKPAAPVETKCSKCTKKPRARATKRTRTGQETWCAACRKAALDVGRTATKKAPVKAVTRATKNTAAKARRTEPPATKAPARPEAHPLRGMMVPTDAAVLDRVSRALVVVEKLGGIERAEALALVIGGAT